MTLLSLRAYALHRKVTLRAVQKAIESGRIKTVLDDKGRARINPEDADKRWDELSDPAKKPPTPRPDPELEVEIEFEREEPKSGAMDYYKAKALRETYVAKTAELNFLERSGKLIETDKVLAQWQKIITTAKTKLLSVPTKVRARLPHMTVADIATIEEEIREALLELANGSKEEADELES